MDRLYQKARAVQRLTDNYIGREVFNNSLVKEFIIDLNTVGQLFDKGIDSTGALLPVYSKTTEILTGGAKVAGEPYTLRDTGEFYETFIVTVDGNGDALIMANTIKQDGQGLITDLLDLASPYIIGLTNESKEKLSRFIIPIIQETVRKVLLSA